MRFTLACALLASLFFVSPARSGESPVPSDFAYGFQVGAEGDGPFFAMDLPLDFYRTVTRSDLSDACMFNARDEVVPFALQTPAVDSPRRGPGVALPIFPVLGEADKRIEGLSLQIRRDNSGAIVDVNTGSGPTPERKVVAYLLDAGAIDLPIKALELDWEKASESFVVKVTVESSDDLDHWTTRVRSATLADLRYGSHSLTQRTIQLRGVKAKFLRLSWPEARGTLALVGASAEPREEAAPPPLRWTALDAEVKKDSAEGYYFSSPGPLPVSRLKVDLPQPNTLVSASLLSRSSEKEPWRPRCSGLVYHLTVKGEDLLNPDLVLSSAVADRFWLLRIDPTGAGLGQGLPKLELGWAPHRLVFIARGTGPFRLAFGNAQAAPLKLHMDDALTRFVVQNKDKMEVSPARPGPMITLGGDSRLRPQVVYPWKEWTLWAVLLLGVILMAWMAYRLYRQMNREGSEQ